MTLSGPVTLTGATIDVSVDANAIASIISVIDDGGNGYSFSKSGEGTLTLGGANTFTGDLNANAGTLLIDGSATAAATTVASGATLGGSGTLNGPVSAQAGTIVAHG